MLAAGLSYAYVVTLPLSLRFLFFVTVPGIVSTLTAQSYLNFVLAQLFVCMLVFQVPIVLVTGMSLNVFTASQLRVKRRYVYLVGIAGIAV